MPIITCLFGFDKHSGKVVRKQGRTPTENHNWLAERLRRLAMRRVPFYWARVTGRRRDKLIASASSS
ncbi:MAG: hypothetical protein ACP5R2_02135 [Anaerolineae bacterium]